MKELTVASTFFWFRMGLLAGIAALSACATGPQITTTQALSAATDAPYENILLIALSKSFSVRRKFEKQVVHKLSKAGTHAVASTSLMDTSTPITRKTFVAMAEKINADAVLVTQVVSLESTTSMKDRRPEATYNVRPTYYYNVWEVELTEYVAPPIIEVESAMVLSTQVYSAATRKVVWAIESKSKVVQDVSRTGYYPFFTDEANAITSHMLADGLITP